MPLVLPTSFYNASYRWSVGGVDHQMSFALAGQLNTGVDADTFASDLAEAWLVGYDPGNWYSAWTFRGCHVIINTGAGFASGESDPGEPGTGGGAETVPPNTAMIFRKGTGFAGAGNRGRMYMPGFSLADADVNNDGTIDATPLATIAINLENWLTETLTNVTAVDGFFLLHEQASPGPGTPTAITQFLLEDTVATQRRRLR
jgi:hypothetical protein